MVDITSHEAPAQKASALPVQQPGKLQGRDKVLGQVYNILKANKPILLYGAAGMGKTALAATLASAYSELPGGVLWLNVQEDSLDSLIVRVGRAYQDEDISNIDTPSAMIGGVASLLTANKPLLVLDGKHNADATSQFISKCAANLPVLLVSKDPLPGWPTLMLEKLDTAAGVALLKHEAKLPADASAADIEKIVTALDGHPFALTIAAGTLSAQKMSVKEYVAALEKIPNPSNTTPPFLALTAAYRAISSPLQGVLLLLGATFGGGASTELLSLISGAPLETIEAAMKVLVDARLVERLPRYDSAYYQVHDITFTFAQTFLKASSRLESTQLKVRDSLLEYARKYSIDSPGAHNHLAAEMQQIIGMAKWCAEQGELDIVRQLVLNLTQAGEFVQDRGYVHELLALRNFSASQTAAFPAYPPPPVPEDMPLAPAPEDEMQDIVEADKTGQLSVTTMPSAHTPPADEPDEPAAPAPVVVVEAPKAEAPKPLVSLVTAPTSDESERPEDLLASMLDGVDDADEADDKEDDADEDDAADEAPTEPEAPLTPVEQMHADLRAAKRDGNHRLEGDIQTKIGDHYLEMKEDTEALASYGDALTAYENAEDKAKILDCLDKLASLAAKTENAGAAVLYATRGIKLADELGEDETKLFLLKALGDGKQLSGENAEATKAFGGALEIARKIGDAQNEALILLNLGFAHLDNGDAEAAAHTWEQALKLFQSQNKRAYEGQAMGGLGSAYGELGRWEEAVRFHTSALYIAREVKNKQEEALQLSNLGYACTQAKRLGEAVTRYRQALHLAFQAGWREDIVSNLLDLARLLSQSRLHLAIAELLTDEGIKLDGQNRDLARMKEKIQSEIAAAKADGIDQRPVTGQARDYAALAYKLLDEE